MPGPRRAVPLAPLLAAAPALALVLALMLAQVLAGCAAAPRPVAVAPPPALTPTARAALFAPDDAALTERFVALALRGEVADGRRSPSLLRFAAPVRIGLSGAGADADTRIRLGWLAAQLAWATGHDIALAAPGEAANLEVLRPARVVADLRGSERARALAFFTSEAAMTETLAAIEASTPLCWFTIRPGPGGAIARGLVVVPAALRDAELWRCLVEEVAQALGLPDDSPDLPYSVFADRAPWLDLTPADLLMLRLLYHPGLRPGMTQSELRMAIPPLLPALRRSFLP